MNSFSQTQKMSFATTPLFLAFLLNFAWINLSEVFRYFVFVMPMMREAFPMITDIAPMSIPVFLIWGLWDTILVAAATIIPWLAFRQFGHSLKSAIWVGTSVWLAIFGILWLGLYNMNLATPKIALLALSLAWFEMIIAALIVRHFAIQVTREKYE